MLKIFSAIKKYVSARPIRFHMPGHKGGKFIKVQPKYDVTELSTIDNGEVVKSAEIDVAKILGAKWCKFLTDGASSGIFALLYAVKDLGKKILISRWSHKSVYNALKLFNIEPIILGGLDKDGLPVHITPKDVELNLSEDVIGAFITYPDYYGRTCDIKGITKVLKDNHKLLLVDNAHGNHYNFSDLTYVGEYADAWVDGVHKTNYTFNQGAVVCVNNSSLIDLVFDGTDVFSTTSPSYIILSSIEYGIKYSEVKGRKKFLALNDRVKNIKAKITNLGLKVVESDDFIKLTVDFGGVGYDVKEAEKILEQNKIYAELIDERRVLFMFSANTKNRELTKLVRTIKKITNTLNKGQTVVGKSIGGGIKKVDYLYAISAKWQLVDLNDAVGKISAQNFGIFPPCFPIVVAGEEITKECVEFLKDKELFGLTQGKVKVLI